MARKKLDPAIGNVLKEHGFGPEACWDCRGTWVVYHHVLEQIAAKEKIVFDPPTVLEANGAAKSVALCVTGRMGVGPAEWATGEAAPGNNKTAYPYAMAEKRAKDRVVLKLIGLHGLVYSEEEADEFKRPASDEPAPEPEPEASEPEMTSAERRAQCVMYLDECEVLEDLVDLVKGNGFQDEIDRMTKKDADAVRLHFTRRRQALQPPIRIEADDNAGIYA